MKQALLYISAFSILINIVLYMSSSRELEKNSKQIVELKKQVKKQQDSIYNLHKIIKLNE